MPPLEIPPEEPVDFACGGVLSAVPFIIGELLCLPKGQQVTEARIGPNGAIHLSVCGKGLPPIEEGVGPVFVTLIFHRELRDGDTGTKQRRTLASWDHDPQQKWVVHDWSAA